MNLNSFNFDQLKLTTAAVLLCNVHWEVRAWGNSSLDCAALLISCRLAADHELLSGFSQKDCQAVQAGIVR